MIRTRVRTKRRKLNVQTFLTKLLENFPTYSMLVHVTFHNCKQEIKYVGSNCLQAFHEPLKSFQNQVIVFLALLSARGLGMMLLFLIELSCFQSVKDNIIYLQILLTPKKIFLYIQYTHVVEIVTTQTCPMEENTGFCGTHLLSLPILWVFICFDCF